MEIDDPVYRQCTVDDPVLTDLLQTRPVQRLRNVNQAGPAALRGDRPVTRYGHSVGVMLLLREYGASLQEQVAGLLHDVPHTAFSHVADFVFDDEDHEYHERFMEDVIRDSRIPAVLQEHGFVLDDILDESAFPLLERDLPDLCADRIDYFLRDWHGNTGERLDRFLDAVAVRDDRFVMTDRSTAEQYALRYLEAAERWWANPEEVATFELFADAIRAALDAGELAEEDLFGTDDDVLHALQQSDVERVTEVMDLFDTGFSVEVDRDDPDFVGETKFRYVDPMVVADGGQCRVTDYSEQVRQRVEEHRQYVESGYPLRIVRH